MVGEARFSQVEAEDDAAANHPSHVAALWGGILWIEGR